MDEVIKDFWRIVESKTTWGVKDLVQQLSKQISLMEYGPIKINYSAALDTFKLNARTITAIGRKQFTNAFTEIINSQNIYFSPSSIAPGPAGSIDPGYLIQEEESRQNSNPSYEYLVAQNVQLKTALKQISAHVDMINSLLKSIDGLIRSAEELQD